MEKDNCHSQGNKVGESFMIDIKALEQEIESLRSENDNLWGQLRELRQGTFQIVSGRNPRIKELECRPGKEEGLDLPAYSWVGSSSFALLSLLFL